VGSGTLVSGYLSLVVSALWKWLRRGCEVVKHWLWFGNDSVSKAIPEYLICLNAALHCSSFIDLCNAFIPAAIALGMIS
jgi:hypothetical protein